MKNNILLFTLLFILLLSGCSPVKGGTEKVTLKVLYDSSDEFMDKYGNTYLAKNENIDFEIVPLSQYYKDGLTEEKYSEIVENEKPDILYGFNLEKYSNEGKLLNLDPYILKSKDFGIDKINTNLLEYIRQKGNGNIYALSPTFAGKALYYNKSLLDQLGIGNPTDGMSWDEVMKLAARISEAGKNSDKIISFYYDSNLFKLTKDIANTMGVNYINSSGKVTFKTNTWKSIMNLVIENAKIGAISTKENYPQSTILEKSIFSQGNVALTVDYSYLLNDLHDVNFEWGVVTLPVDSRQPGSIDAMQPNALFGVSSSSSHVQESVDFIKYINGEQFARLFQKSDLLSNLPSREEYSQNILKVDLHAFYSIPPLEKTDLSPISLDQFTKVNETANELIKDAVSNETSIDKLLESLQNNTEAILNKE